MIYAIVIEREARKNILALQRPIATRIAGRIGRLANEPRPRDTVKLTGRDREYRLRVGVYRAIDSIDDNERIVKVHYVRHRKDAYL